MVCRSFTHRVSDIHTANQDCAYVPSNHDDDNGFLGTVTSEAQHNPWAFTIQLNNVTLSIQNSQLKMAC